MSRRASWCRKAQEKAVVVTFDHDIAEVPANPCFENIALIDERTLEITFRKDKVNAGQVLARLTAEACDRRRVDPRPRPRGRVPEPRFGRPGSGVSITADVLIVGSGAAGLTAALNLAETHKVAVIAKGALGDSASARAQGGIAAVLEEGDSFEAHVNDTMIAGAGLNDRKVVEHVVEAAPRAIQHLIELGVPFAAENGALHLTREGGHSHRRIVHVADATGWAISQALEVRGRQAPQHHAGAGHGRGRPRHRPPCAAFLDQRRGPRPLRLQSQEEARRNADRPGDDPRHRRGGPRLSLFDRAARRDRRRDRHGVAGGLPHLQHGVHAVPPDLPLQSRGQEFPDHRGGARRGRAAQAAARGQRRRQALHAAFDERAELAPRDIVARAIDHEIKRLGLDYVHLDISHRDPDFVRAHFPNIYEKLLGLGIDITREPIPVVPAQHYTCGGVVVDLDGCTDAPGLYAAGEVTQSGLHGANRLASNSLLECLVFGEAAAQHIVANLAALPDVPESARGTKAGSPTATRKS